MNIDHGVRTKTGRNASHTAAVLAALPLRSVQSRARECDAARKVDLKHDIPCGFCGRAAWGKREDREGILKRLSRFERVRGSIAQTRYTDIELLCRHSESKNKPRRIRQNRACQSLH